MSIKVGIPVSLTGQFSLQGSQTLAGLRAWADDVNRAGGLEVGGIQHPVQLIWRDDGSRRDNARVITQQLIVADRVDLLIGPYSAVLTNAAAEVAEVYAKLLWNQGGASPLVYQRGNPWVVGILTPADEYMAGLLPAVREVCFGVTAVAVVRAAKGAFPREVVSGVERTASALGFRVALSLQFDPETEDFSEVVQAVCRVEPDVLVVAGRFQNDLALATLLANAAPNIGTVAVVAAGVDAFRERLGDKAENFIGPSQWEPDAGYAVDFGPSVADVQASLRQAGNPVIDYPTAQAYAVGVVIQRCVEEFGGLDDGALRQAAASLDFTTFYGRFRIDAETGRPVGKPALLAQWRQGRKAIVWPPECRNERLAYPWRPQVPKINSSPEETP
jgi:branched-chain amino acid transport system substrate-binding protein